ncbi:MAG: neuromedin U [Gammaproteobacteria bacterium]
MTKSRIKTSAWMSAMLINGMVCSQQSSAADDTSLAVAAQNPLATLVTLPLQANYNKGVGPNDRTLFNLNVQPVVPITGDKWNVIVRTIIPVNSVPQGQTDSTFGIGDTNLTLFWSPAKPGKVIWGVGPAFGLPTASNPEELGSEKWSAGPSGVLFYIKGNWTMGGVASNLWSIAGDDDRADVNLLTLQYFVNYNLGEGWAIGTAPIISANWEADSDNTWTIPWGLQVSKITRIGSQPVNLLLGYYTNSEHPDNGAESQLRLQLNFLFPSEK